ncbi:Monocarboxylate transporter 9, partial [Smittium culicis]
MVSKIGIRNVAWLGGVISFIGLFSASFVNSVPALIGTQGFLLGIGSGFVFSCSISVTAMWFDKYRGAAVGIAVSGERVKSTESQKVIDLSGLKSPPYILLSLCGFVANMGFVVPIYFLPSSALQLGASDSFASNIVTIFNVGYFLGSIANGRLADIFGPANMFAL